MNGFNASRAVAVAACALALLVVAAANPAGADAACKKATGRMDRIAKVTARAAIRCIINKKRSNLRAKEQLRQAARAHTRYMRRSRCFSHQCSGEASLYERIRATGYLSGARSYGYGEVLAKQRDEASPRDIVRAWMASPGHRATIMNSAFEHIGIALSVRRRSALVTADLGHRSG